jgi:hypothetical protein
MRVLDPLEPFPATATDAVFPFKELSVIFMPLLDLFPAQQRFVRRLGSLLLAHIVPRGDEQARIR